MRIKLCGKIRPLGPILDYSQGTARCAQLDFSLLKNNPGKGLFNEESLAGRQCLFGN
jgi:hypothetical protein